MWLVVNYLRFDGLDIIDFFRLQSVVSVHITATQQFTTKNACLNVVLYLL